MWFFTCCFFQIPWQAEKYPKNETFSSLKWNSLQVFAQLCFFPIKFPGRLHGDITRAKFGQHRSSLRRFTNQLFPVLPLNSPFLSEFPAHHLSLLKYKVGLGVAFLTPEPQVAPFVRPMGATNGLHIKGQWYVLHQDLLLPPKHAVALLLCSNRNDVRK